MGQQHRHQAEQHRIQQAYPAVQIERPVGIVPPLGVEQFFHKEGSQILQRAGYHHSRSEQGQQVVLYIH